MLEGRGSEYGVVHLRVDNVPVADQLLLESQELIRLGSVYLNDSRLEQSFPQVEIGDYIRIHTRPRRFSKPENLSSRILEAHSDFYIVDKPSGLPVHSQVDNSRENLISFLEEELREKLFVTHRLDIETSGCLLVARSKSSQENINRLFRERQIRKYYVAQVENFIEPKFYRHFMKSSFTSPRIVSENEEPGWVSCEMEVLSCEKLDEAFKCKVELFTGRPQQIRAQLSYLGSPIIGDTKYGSKIRYAEKSIALRGSELIFNRACK